MMLRNFTLLGLEKDRDHDKIKRYVKKNLALYREKILVPILSDVIYRRLDSAGPTLLKRQQAAFATLRADLARAQTDLQDIAGRLSSNNESDGF